MISITESDIFTAIGNLLTVFLPALEIIQGQTNRVVEPSCSDFIVMWPLSRTRLETNIDYDSDTQIVGSINDNILNVTSLTGTIYRGTLLFSLGLPVNGCPILCQNDGPVGGVGYYQTQNAPNLKSQTFYCGSHGVMQPTEFVVQCDVHGPCSGDNATTISSLWRDDYGASLAITQGGLIAPFYADDPRQMPFINAEQQYEERWVVDLHMQVNMTVNVPQQFADELSITTIDVLPNSGEAHGGGAIVNSSGIIE